MRPFSDLRAKRDAGVLAVIFLFYGCAAAPLAKPSLMAQIERTQALYDQGRLVEALASAQAAMQSAGDAHGLEHPLALRTKHKLALLYAELGYGDQAERMWRQVMDVASRVPGYPVHDTILVACDLANLYQRQERYSDAEPLYLLALALLEEARGLSYAEQRELARRLEPYLEVMQATGRSEDRVSMRMQIELLIQSARRRVPESGSVQGWEQGD